ncbi:hypothetical protein KW786_03735 [Candidatus Parcubacteria bacterium]|nr:hypothetical protein [Candidatus Parcubacteria bacterium]
MKIIRPKIYPGGVIHGPLIYFGGPIRGADDWQAQAFLMMKERLVKFTAVIPCRWENDHPLREYFLEGRVDTGHQLDWELYWMQEAARWSTIRMGCLLFWLQQESKTHPRPGGCFARDTRFELGGLCIEAKANPKIRLVIGGDPEVSKEEPGFDGFDVLERNFKARLGREYTFHRTLNATIDAVVRAVSV